MRASRYSSMQLIRILIIASLAAAANVYADSLSAANPLAWQKIRLGPSGAAYPFPVYANHDLSGDLRRIKQAVIVQHGRSRNGDGYFLAAAKLMKANGIDAQETLLIAPQFFAVRDTGKADLSGMPVWSTRGWSGGADSLHPPLAVSSLQVLDDLLTRLSDRRAFPALSRIVLAGHSAGGQLVQRYAVLNRVDGKLRAAGIELRYVVANPSSYLYFTDERPNGDGFAPYPGVAACPGFNDYRYGFNRPVRYAANETPAETFKRYLARDVVYLLGTADIDPAHSSLDKSCAAQAQGRFRLERGRAYVRYEQYLARGQTDAAHRAYEVFGVAHSQAGMFGSVCGVNIIFGVTDTTRVKGAPCIEAVRGNARQPATTAPGVQAGKGAILHAPAP